VALQEPSAQAMRWSSAVRQARVPLRIILFIAVVALFIDAYFYSGAFTQAVFFHVARAGEQFVAYISDTVVVIPNGDGATTEP
jgi:hypothetical protein